MFLFKSCLSKLTERERDKQLEADARRNVVLQSIHSHVVQSRIQPIPFL